MSLQVTFAYLEEAVAFELGWDRTSNNWSTDRDNLFETIKRIGLSLFENPPPLPNERTAHQWSWLFPFASLELSPSYSTGTVTIVAGVATLADGTWPSWAAQGDLWIIDEGETQRYSVASGPAGATITLNDTGVGVAAGTSYTLRRHAYNMPTDFGGMYGSGFTFRRDSLRAGQMLRQVGGHDLRMYDLNELDGIPQVYSLEPITTSNTTTWLAKFAPLPDDTYFLEYQYRAIMGDITTGNAYGGAVHSETILAAVRHAARQRVHQDESLYGEFMRKLEMSVRYDRQNFKPTDLGVGRCGSSNYPHRHYRGSIDDATFSFI